MTSVLWKSAVVGAMASVGLGGVAQALPAQFMPALADGVAPTTTLVQFGGHGIRRIPGGRLGGFRGGGFHGGGRRFGGGYGGGDRRGGGFGIGAGVAGLAAGALIGGAIASQASPSYGYGYGGGYGYNGGYDGGYAQAPIYGGYAPGPVAVESDDADVGQTAGGDPSAYCAQRFKSYDPSSGTYLGYDGLRHPCP